MQMALVWATVAVCVLICISSLAGAVQVTECHLGSTGVYVSISAESETVDTISLRWLDVNWFGMDVQDGDWVALVDKSVLDVLGSLRSWLEVSEPDGTYRTDVRWNGSLIPTSVENIGDSCLPYEAIYVRNNTVLHSSCLMLRPRWFEPLKSLLWDTPLTKVVFPGTHDAGASGHFGLPIVGDLVGRWTFTQDESLWQQLVMGTRYMDMRIAYYNNTEEKFFVNHGDVRIAPLKRYIDNVVDFMKQTEEIVIFDIHGLPHGFSGYPERQQELIALLESSFSSWIVPKSLEPNPKMGELWERDRRLIVTYPSAEGSNSQYLWSPVHHVWGNVNNLDDLKTYMYTAIPQQADSNFLWSAMTEFTPSTLDVTLNRWGGLRGAAVVTNSPVTSWLRQDWWNLINIIAMDFMPSSDVVSVAVSANKMRHFCSYKKRLRVRGKRWWSGFKAKEDYENIYNRRHSRINPRFREHV